MAGPGLTLIYDRDSTRDFLAARVFEDHRVITADPQDTVQGLLAAVAAMPLCRRFLFHLNATRTAHWPIERAALVADLKTMAITVLNAGVVDISKRAVMDVVDRLALPSVRLGRDEADDRLVIVKTDANYGGKHDGPPPWGARLLRVPEDDNPGGYVVGALRDVRTGVLKSPALVVQRYVANAGGHFIRVYKVLDRIVVSLARSDHPIKKMGAGATRQNFAILPGASVPRAVSDAAIASSAVAREMGLDFGTIDVALDDENCPHVIDVNSTPYWGDETQEDIIAHLRQS